MRDVDLAINELLERYPNSSYSLIVSTPRLRSEATSFLKENSFLLHAPDYAAYLKKYGGISYVSDSVDFNLYGVDAGVSLHIRDGEGAVINDDGYICIGDFTDHSSEPERYITSGLFFFSDKVSEGIFYNQFDQFENSSGYIHLCRNFKGLLQLLSSGRVPEILKPNRPPSLL